MITNWFIMNFATILLRSKIETFGIKGAWVQFLSLTMELLPCTLIIIMLHSFQRPLRTVWVKRKFTAPNEACYSNQVLDTKILWVVSVKEWNSRIELSTKFSTIRDNQPKRNRKKHLFCFFPQNMLNNIHESTRNFVSSCSACFFKFKSTFTIAWSLSGKV